MTERTKTVAKLRNTDNDCHCVCHYDSSSHHIMRDCCEQAHQQYDRSVMNDEARKEAIAGLQQALLDPDPAWIDRMNEDLKYLQDDVRPTANA